MIGSTAAVPLVSARGPSFAFLKSRWHRAHRPFRQISSHARCAATEVNCGGLVLLRPAIAADRWRRMTRKMMLFRSATHCRQAPCPAELRADVGHELAADVSRYRAVAICR